MRFDDRFRLACSGVFYKNFGEKIKAAITDQSSADKNLCFFVKKSACFQILKIPSLGARGVGVSGSDLFYQHTELISACIQT